MKTEHYEPRELTLLDSENNSSDYSNDGKKLYEHLNDFDKLVVIGNPGIGKSEELKQLFNKLWEEREETGILPIIINLQNFRKVHRFSDLIRYNDWETHQRIVFILDGLDEIANIEDFLSELNNFINQNRLRNIKYVLSCRHNIYLSFKTGLSHFRILNLHPFNTIQIRSFLKRKFCIDIGVFDIEKNIFFLENPFFLELFGEGHIDAKDIKVSPTFLDHAINLKIEQHLKKKVNKRVKISKPELLKSLQSIALVCELMQATSLTEEQVFTITNQNFIDLTENPFLTKYESIGTSSFKFIHRQYQEYFVAKFLSALSFAQLLKIVALKIERINPSLLNSVTFFLSLSDSADRTSNEFIEWLIEHEFDVFFLSDLDRTKPFQIKVFQIFFSSKIQDSKLWLNNITSVSEEQIGRFADCDENLEYLKPIVLSPTKHFRVRINGLRILHHFSPRSDKNFIQDLFDVLKPDSKSFLIHVHTEIISLFAKWNIVQHREEIVNEVFDVFKDFDHSAISTNLIDLVYSDIKNIEKYKDFVFREMDFEFERKTRKNDDGTLRGIELKLIPLILLIEDNVTFLSFLEKLLSVAREDRQYEDFYFDSINKRLLEIKHSQHKTILIDVFERLVDDETRSFYTKEILIQHIENIGIACQLFERLFTSEKFVRCKTIIGHLLLLDEDNMSLLEKRFFKEIGIGDALFYLRNFLKSYQKRDLAIRIENLLVENEIEVAPKLSELSDKETVDALFKKQIEDDLIKMFAKKVLIEECRNHFQDKEDKLVFNKEIYRRIEKIDIDTDPSQDPLVYYFSYEPLALRFLNHALIEFNRREFSFEDFQERYSHSKNYFDFIYNEALHWAQKAQVPIHVSIINEMLNQEVNNLIGEFDFSNLFTFHDDKTFGCDTPEKHEALKFLGKVHILCLSKDFSISVNDQFYLDTLEYFGFNYYNDGIERFDKLFELIQDRESAQTRLLENLKKEMISMVYERHALMAIKLDLIEAKNDIHKYISKNYEIRKGDALFDSYMKWQNEDTGLLEDLRYNVNTESCWTAIDYMVKNNISLSQCKSIANEYLASGEKQFLFEAAKTLFKLKEQSIIDFLLNDLKNNSFILNNVGSASFQDYDMLPSKGIEEFKRLFFYTYGSEGHDEYYFSEISRFFMTYSSNLIRNKNLFSEINSLFKEIKEEVGKENDDRKLFYINMLIEDSEKIYVSSLSKGMEFNEALKLVQNLRI